MIYLSAFSGDGGHCLMPQNQLITSYKGNIKGLFIKMLVGIDGAAVFSTI